MEVELNLRLHDSIAHQCLSTALSPFHKQTHFHHTLLFDCAAGDISACGLILLIRFFGEDLSTAHRCVVSFKDEPLVSSNGVSTVHENDDEEEEEIDPFWGREIQSDPSLIGSVESRVLERVREEFGNDGGGFVCLGGFKDVRRVYEWSGLKVVVDETSFEFGKLYEVECVRDDSGSEVEKGKGLIESLMKDNGIVYTYSTMSKFEVFRAGKLPLTFNIVGGDAASVSNRDVINKTLWQYVTKLQKFGGGGNISFRCNYCEGTYKGSYSRVKAHLLKIPGLGIKHCSKVTAKHVEEMKRLVNGTEMRVKKVVPLDCYWPSPPASSESSSERKTLVSVACPGKELTYSKGEKRLETRREHQQSNKGAPRS